MLATLTQFRLSNVTYAEAIPTHPVSDHILPTPREGSFGIRIYLPQDEGSAPMVDCSELRSNGGTSATSTAEKLAARR